MTHLVRTWYKNQATIPVVYVSCVDLGVDQATAHATVLVGIESSTVEICRSKTVEL